MEITKVIEKDVARLKKDKAPSDLKKLEQNEHNCMESTIAFTKKSVTTAKALALGRERRLLIRHN